MTETDLSRKLERCKISSVPLEGSYSCQWSFPLLLFFSLLSFPPPLSFRFTLSPPLSSSIVQFTRYQVGGKIYRAPVSGIWVNGFTFYSRSRPSIRPCDFLRPVMVNIYIYTFSSSRAQSYVSGKRKINENNERRKEEEREMEILSLDIVGHPSSPPVTSAQSVRFFIPRGMPSSATHRTKLRPVSIGRATRTPVDLLQLQHETWHR